MASKETSEAKQEFVQTTAAAEEEEEEVQKAVSTESQDHSSRRGFLPSRCRHAVAASITVARAASGAGIFFFFLYNKESELQRCGCFLSFVCMRMLLLILPHQREKQEVGREKNHTHLH